MGLLRRLYRLLHPSPRPRPHQPCEGQTGFRSGQPNKAALFAWHEGSATQLSAPPPSQCHSPSPCASAATATAIYDGASPSGERAWFTTPQPLIDSDTDSGNDLYLAKLKPDGELEELVQASKGEPGPGTANGDGAGVQGVVQISPEGNAAAFVATGVLTTEPNSNGAASGESAAQGADNLYLYDAETAKTKFVARLCSGDEQSGSLADPACPGSDRESLWAAHTNTVPEAELTPDGHFLLFTSYGRLTPDKTSETTAAYRYDFSTGQLIRISVGRDGNDANGNGSDGGVPREDGQFPVFLNHEEGGAGKRLVSGAALAGDFNRSISADGAVAIFSTAAPLVSRDTNTGPTPGCYGAQNSVGYGVAGTGCDVYEWEESGHGTCHEAGGCVRLISDGLQPFGSHLPLIDASGENIVFYTPRGLYPGDTDGVGDIYDARVDGGFHYTPSEPICHSAERCRGEGTHEASHPSFGTEQFAGPENEKEVEKPHKHCKKGYLLKHNRCLRKKTTKKHHKAKHKRADRRAAGHNRGGAK